MKKVIMICLVSIMISACMMRVGNHNSVNYTPIDNIRYHSRVENVLVYFDGAQPKEDYVQLGLVEVQGARMATKSDLLKNLKYKALEVGADAVVNVKSFYKTRQSGRVHDVFLEDNYKPQTYESVVMQGLAVRFKNIENLQEDEQKYLQTKDRTMQSYIRKEKRQNASDDDSDFFSTIIFWVLVVVASAG